MAIFSTFKSTYLPELKDTKTHCKPTSSTRAHNKLDMTKYRVPTRSRRTPKTGSRSTIVLNPPVDSTKRYISKIELINELFDLVLCEFNVQKLLRLRRVAQHWKSQIDSSSAVQRVLLLKSTIPRSIIELKFTHPQDLVERSASLSNVPRSRKNRIPVKLNALLCKKSNATNEPDLLECRISKKRHGPAEYGHHYTTYPFERHAPGKDRVGRSTTTQARAAVH